MAKIIVRKNAWPKGPSQEEIQAALSEDNLGYVLVTCSRPNEQGDMQVEFSYDGEEILAGYLLDSARSVIDDKLNQSQGVGNR